MLGAVVVGRVLVGGWVVSAVGVRRGRVAMPGNLLAMATIGPLLFVLLWPWMWNDTFARIQEYVNWHVHHEYYNIEFLGKNYFGPPSPATYAPVMIFASVPSISVLLFLIGAGERVSNGAARVVRSFRAWLGLVGGGEAAPPPHPPSRTSSSPLETNLTGPRGGLHDWVRPALRAFPPGALPVRFCT